MQDEGVNYSRQQRIRRAWDRIPILQVEDYLLASIQVPLHDELALRFQRDLLDMIEQSRAKGVIIDITAIDVVDSFITRILVETARMASLMGAETVIVGLRPEISITLVEFGVEFENIKTALDLEHGIKILKEKTLDKNLSSDGRKHHKMRGNGDTGDAT
ncbi:hypothetical protein DRN79_02610 [Methanosarcinales archaeon]|nr:MAG: hypothetical protein DRN79_02610 [Methanosarcinales archaeon]